MWVSTIRSFYGRKSLLSCKFSSFYSVSAAVRNIPSDPDLNVEAPPILGQSSVEDFIKLDNSRVIGMLKTFSQKPIVALSFFNSAKNHGFRHDVDTYWEIIRILYNWGLHRQLNPLFAELVLSKKELGFEISNLFDSICERCESSRLVARVFDVLIKVYIDLCMFDEAIDALFQMGSHGFVPRVQSCNFLMNCLIERGKSNMARAVYHQLKRFGISPNVYTFAIVIKSFCREGNLEEAVDVMKEMQEKGVAPDVFTYTTLISGMCSCKKSDTGFELLKAVRSVGVPINTFSYNVVIHGFSNEMRFQEAEEVFEDMGKHGIVPDMYSYSGLIRGYCRHGNLSRALSLHDEMVSRDRKSVV